MKRLISSGLLLLAAVGCGSKEPGTETATGPSGAAPTTTAGTPQTALVTNGASTEPGEIVALFLDSLRRGDEKAANGVLTTQAQTSLAQTDYTIDPMGTPNGKYTIGRVGYVDGDSTTCLVECLWTEPSPQAGQPPVEMDIVCEVHKEPQGWRISGMAVKMTGTEDTFVLDFEDPKSLQQALGGEQQPAATPANVAQTPGGVTPAGAVSPDLGVPSIEAQLPAQPGFPTAQQQQPQLQQPQGGPAPLPQFPSEGQQPTQIAFPPTPGVNR